MQKILKGYVFRLYPTDKQRELIEKSFGCSRYIYNYFLGKSNGYIYASINIMFEGIKLYMKKANELQSI